MKGIFKSNFQGRNAFISNDYYLRTYGRPNAGRRSRTFAAWRAAWAPSLHFERCVFSLRRTLCSMVERGVVGPLQGESCPLLMQEDNPHGELSCRHVHAFVHSLLGTGGVTRWTLRPIPMDSIDTLVGRESKLSIFPERL